MGKREKEQKQISLIPRVVVFPNVTSRELYAQTCQDYIAVESLQRNSRGPPVPQHPLFPGDEKEKNPKRIRISYQRALVASGSSV